METTFLTIDCAPNPLDMRPAVDGIVNRIDQVCGTLRKGQPLVVLIGEHHGMPAHILIQAMLSDRLSADPRRITAFGFELPHNLLGDTISWNLPYALNAGDEARISASDTDGHMALAAALGYIDHHEGPVSRHALFKFCLSRQLPMRFNDAALTKSFMLNKRDQLTSDVVKIHALEHINSPIHGYSPVGMHLRNRIIAENVSRHMRDKHADIYVQNCGRDHIFGNRHRGRESNHGLAAVLEDKGISVLNIFMQSEADDFASSIPADASRFLDRTVFIKNMARDAFKLGIAKEGEFFKQLCAESGMDYPLFRCDSLISVMLPAERARMRKDVRIFASRWALDNPGCAQ